MTVITVTTHLFLVAPDEYFRHILVPIRYFLYHPLQKYYRNIQAFLQGHANVFTERLNYADTPGSLQVFKPGYSDYE